MNNKRIFLKLEKLWLTRPIKNCLVAQCWYVGKKGERHELSLEEHEFIMKNMKDIPGLVQLVFEEKGGKQ